MYIPGNPSYRQKSALSRAVGLPAPTHPLLQGGIVVAPTPGQTPAEPWGPQELSKPLLEGSLSWASAIPFLLAALLLVIHGTSFLETGVCVVFGGRSKASTGDKEKKRVVSVALSAAEVSNSRQEGLESLALRTNPIHWTLQRAGSLWGVGSLTWASQWPQKLPRAFKSVNKAIYQIKKGRRLRQGNLLEWHLLPGIISPALHKIMDSKRFK